MASPVDIVRRFRSVRALVLGDAMLDTYLEGTAARICSEGPVPVVRKTAEHRAPGGAANMAANLATLGAEVFFAGAVGEDVTATLLRAALRECSVDDRWLVFDAALTTLHKLRILADGQYVVRYDEETGRALPETISAKLLERVEELFFRCDLVVVSDYGYGVVTEALVARLRELRAGRPCPLFVDSKQLHRFPRMGATVIKPNALEACFLTEHPAPAAGAHLTPDEVAAIGRKLLERHDAEHAAITLAGDGVCVIDRAGNMTHVPAHPVEKPNDVGAGDTFGAAMALALVTNADVAEAARIGIDAAGIAVTKRWTAVVQQQELLQRVSLREHAERQRARVPATEAAARGALSEVMSRLAAARRAGQTIVFTNGVFDILHAGHVELLRQAKALGDVLVVGINSDRSARRLKGRNRPINGERDRMALVAALDSVDDVVLFDDDTPAQLIRALRPHIHVKGGDYAGETLPEAEAVREVGGRIEILPLVSRHSTSGVIERIVSLAAGAELVDAHDGHGGNTDGYEVAP